MLKAVLLLWPQMFLFLICCSKCFESFSPSLMTIFKTCYFKQVGPCHSFMARVFKAEVMHKYAALLRWNDEVQRCSCHCLLALVLSPTGHQQESCLKYCVMPGKLTLQDSSRLHHINSLLLLSMSCPLPTHGERKAYLFRTSPWKSFFGSYMFLQSAAMRAFAQMKLLTVIK